MLFGSFNDNDVIIYYCYEEVNATGQAVWVWEGETQVMGSIYIQWTGTLYSMWSVGKNSFLSISIWFGGPCWWMEKWSCV